MSNNATPVVPQLQSRLHFVNGSPPEGWPLWMERQIARAGFVLVACTAAYLRRYQGEEEPGKGLGATWKQRSPGRNSTK